MQYDVQIQMIVSIFKLFQSLDVDLNFGRVSMWYEVKCDGGVCLLGFEEIQVVVSIWEVFKLIDKYLGIVEQDNGRLYIWIVVL